MKQHITGEQLNELNQINKGEIMDWMESRGYGLYPNIGQMIEFLLDNLPDYGYLSLGWSDEGRVKVLDNSSEAGKRWKGKYYYGESDMVYFLWEAVKDVLAKEE